VIDFVSDLLTCPDCGAPFKSEESLRQHKGAKHRLATDKPKTPLPSFRLPKNKWLGVIVAILLLGAAWYAFGQTAAPAVESVSFPPQLSPAAMHIHSELSIVQNGIRIPIPKDIGIGKIHQPIHTHENDNVIHVESSDTRAYTLGNFFQVWKKSLNTTCVADYCGKVEMTVDGKPNDDLGRHVLKDGEKIEVRVATNAP